MYEIEVKARADPDRIRERVRDLGADYVETVTQDDTYYDHPSRSFAATDEALRIRRERTEPPDTERSESPATTLLTYKGPRVDAKTKTRVEHETAIDDFDAINAILTAVGFDAAFTVEKTRERYAYSRYHIAIDHVADLGWFVEVEATGTDDDLDRLRSATMELLGELGVPPDEFIQSSYLELLQCNNQE